MSAGKAFSGGFFGCFGALAAAGVLLAGLLSLGTCSAEKPPSSGSSEKRADAVVACGLALLEAERANKVGQDSQLQAPWRVYEMGEGRNGARRVSCAAIDDRGELGVIVDVACPDVNDAKCHPLVEITRP